MSDLFKRVQDHTKRFNDVDLQKMSNLWHNNDGLTVQELRMKWDTIIVGMNPGEFIKKLRYTIRNSKEHMKKLYKIDHDDRDVFENHLEETTKALERVYLSN